MKVFLVGFWLGFFWLASKFYLYPGPAHIKKNASSTPFNNYVVDTYDQFLKRGFSVSSIHRWQVGELVNSPPPSLTTDEKNQKGERTIEIFNFSIAPA